MAENDRDDEEPKVHDKRRIDPETGEPREQTPAPAADAPADDKAPEGGDDGLSDDDLALLADAERDLVAEYREIAARAQADLKNFRTRVERDRAANREAVIAEVIRSLLPVIDDLDRADAHGDLVEGAPLMLVSQKLRAGFERYGLRRVGEVGEPFDPNFHEAVVQVPEEGAEGETVKDIIQTGYALGDRLIRAAKVAVSVPASE
ncbi:nucleotide exchange factor GrpE [Homoserinibacter sp. GY 40078]|uniref:nucleotide exchange factor GrpE n=1 Tax=Homoserinibacter sp. GY 40078 TaxID=2603275 RepID=UPI00210225A8|nr:nucleotide exchange factor GrpE [Homoserinibacter sp. GY 40078]